MHPPYPPLRKGGKKDQTPPTFPPLRRGEKRPDATDFPPLAKGG